MSLPADQKQNARTLTELLAPVILQTGVPLQAITAIGDIIALDARLLDYGGAPSCSAYRRRARNRSTI